MLKPQPQGIASAERVGRASWTITPESNRCAVDFKAPIYAPGDRLWVRESWQGLSYGDYLPTKSQVCDLRYAATDPLTGMDAHVRGYPWRPSVHMPRWASRITLHITDVRVQRLQDISRGDAMSEGCPFPNMQNGPDPRDWFRDLWNSLHGPDAWAANPWVCALTFTVQRGNIDQVAACAS
ncbi:hypothetical protein [Paracoccus sp. (in: a-proteobacteria)]|uniref:hypothetical protein n=1 Tax=Paracoccus sp. TaxID=267 RepID=UPI00272D06F0|nr:hypothetical protein [Paracoccus sp. (in: a-proteobacteria)]